MPVDCPVPLCGHVLEGSLGTSKLASRRPCLEDPGLDASHISGGHASRRGCTEQARALLVAAAVRSAALGEATVDMRAREGGEGPAAGVLGTQRDHTWCQRYEDQTWC